MSWNWIATAAPVVGPLACIAGSSATPHGSDKASGIGGLFRGAVAMAAIWAARLALAAVLALTGCRHKPTPEELMEHFISQKEANSKRKIYRDTVQGKPLALLQDSCKVYRLEATSEGVTGHEVLRPGFVLWFTGCVDQRVWRDGEYIFAELNNMQIGAGSGNDASGGTYRSKNAMDWEKQTEKGWRPVAEAQ